MISNRDGLVRRLIPPDGYHLAASMRLLALGPHDPCSRFIDGRFWWTARGPHGPVSLAVHRDGIELIATAYGPGAAWALERADAVTGLRDDVTDFPSVAGAHPVVAELARVHRGIRLPATGQVFPRLLRAILEQKVTGTEAYRGYSAAVRHFSEPAPGPVTRLWLPPAASAVAGAGYWVFHLFGVEQRRAETVLRAAIEAARLERCPDSAALTRRLVAINGIGAWTAAEVVRTVFGDADAVSVGDYHIPNMVAWSLAGQARADDARMMELLEPFRGHRGRVCVLLAAAGLHAPRFGPRLPIRSFARF